MEKPPTGVLLIDGARIFVAANDVACDLLGVADEQLLGSRSDDFMPKIARPIYPLVWQGFLRRGSASGEYAAERPDGSLQRLAYTGFANRPIRGLHLFVLQGLPGQIDWHALVPVKRADYHQVGLDLPAEIEQRLLREADRAERDIPLSKGASTAVVAALFDHPEPAVEALDALRGLGSVTASVATAAGATPDAPLTVLAGRVPYSVVGPALREIHERGGRNMGTFDVRRTGP